MSDLAKNLLTQYYGLGEESDTKKILSVCRSVETANDIDEKLIIDESSVSTNDEKLTEENECQNIISDKTNSTYEGYIRSSRVLSDSDDTDDSNEKSHNFVIDLGENIICDVFEDPPSPTEKLSNDFSPCSAKPLSSDTQGAEGVEENDLSTYVDDGLPDTASEMSSIFTLKTSQKSLRISLTPSPRVSKREPICNSTFADYSNAELSFFPIEILCQFPTLRMLYLENNNLIDLPDELFTSLTHLEWLDVRNNQITSIPTTIKGHPFLETLLLQGNRIEKLPPEFCLVPKLKTLHVTQNPLIVPPEHIVALGCASILEFLREEWNRLHPEEPVKYKERSPCFEVETYYDLYLKSMKNLN